MILYMNLSMKPFFYTLTSFPMQIHWNYSLDMTDLLKMSAIRMLKRSKNW